MIEIVVQEFDVSDSDVANEVEYVSSGSLEISVDTETSENEVADAVVSSLSGLFDLHPRDVRIVSVDLATGEVLYEIASPSYTEATEIQSNIRTLQSDDIESEIQQSLPSAGVESVEVDDSVTVDVTIVFDGSEAGNIGQAKRDVIEILNNQGFEVVTDVAIITSAPTVSPTFTTRMPSPAPSITGIVVTLTLAKSDEILNVTEVTALEAQLAEDYGVNAEDITIEAEYLVSGTVDLDNLPDDISDSALETIVQESIANSLGVHLRDVNVAVDPTTGEVTYTVTSDNDNVANDLQEALDSSTFAEELTAEITTSLPSVTVSSVTAEDEIEMNLVVTIDATESSTDIEKANEEVVSNFEDQGFSIDSESNIDEDKLFSKRKFP